MVDVTLDYPEDLDLEIDHVKNQITSFKILPPGWVKLKAGGWPTKGSTGFPMNLTIVQEHGNLSVICWAEKH